MGRLLGLDALRGMAALLVAIMHAEVVFHEGQLFASAGLMVDFFFMLSGYVMARTYEGRMAAGMPPIAFTGLRFRRLLPPIAIGIAIGFTVYLMRGAELWPLSTILAFSLLMLPNLVIKTEPFPLNPPQWSITYELLGNFLHALVLWRLDVRKLSVLTAACALLLLIKPWMDIRETPWSFVHAVPRLMLPYAIGIIAWRVIGDRPRLPLWIALVALPLTMPICIFGDYLIGSHILLLIIIFIMPVILISGLAPVAGLWTRRAAAMSGALSFPLYAIHSPVLTLVHLMGGTKWLALMASLCVAALISAIVERKLFTGLTARPRAKSAQGLMAARLQGTEERS